MSFDEINSRTAKVRCSFDFSLYKEMYIHKHNSLYWFHNLQEDVRMIVDITVI